MGGELPVEVMVEMAEVVEMEETVEEDRVEDGLGVELLTVSGLDHQLLDSQPRVRERRHRGLWMRLRLQYRRSHRVVMVEERIH